MERGIVVSRAGGIHPAILTTLKVLVVSSSKIEWEAVAEQAIGDLITENSGGKENEHLARVAAQRA